jgi:hypothetical protein
MKLALLFLDIPGDTPRRKEKVYGFVSTGPGTRGITGVGGVLGDDIWIGDFPPTPVPSRVVQTLAPPSLAGIEIPYTLGLPERLLQPGGAPKVDLGAYPIISPGIPLYELTQAAVALGTKPISQAVTRDLAQPIFGIPFDFPPQPTSPSLELGRATPRTVPKSSTITTLEMPFPFALGGVLTANKTGGVQFPTGKAETKDPCKVCKEKNKAKRKEPKPRTICYEGTFIEHAHGISKHRRKQIPCQ